MKVETPALWAFEEDILTRSWLDWLEAHTSFMKPLHRYEGAMMILSDRLSFFGMDKRTGEEFSLNVYRGEIEQLYLGFDSSFKALETRGLGLLWVPLRITFSQAGEEKKLYVITNYSALGTSDNRSYFELLESWLG